MIPTEREPVAMGRPYEHCCFCRAHTPFWTTLPHRKPGEQVAVCLSCAKTHAPAEVPTKQAWCDSEAKREGT